MDRLSAQPEVQFTTEVRAYEEAGVVKLICNSWAIKNSGTSTAVLDKVFPLPPGQSVSAGVDDKNIIVKSMSLHFQNDGSQTDRIDVVYLLNTDFVNYNPR